MSENMSRFAHCKLNNVKLYLNLECYPYDDMNLDFDKNRWSILYDTYARFCKNYYGLSQTESNCHEFSTKWSIRDYRLLSQNESIKSATLDMRLEFDVRRMFPWIPSLAHYTRSRGSIQSAD